MNITLMKQLCETSPQRLFKFLINFLNTKGYDVYSDKGGEWIIAKGTDPLILCAHMDAVFDAPPTNIYIDAEAHVMWSPQGLGADDKAGIYAIIDVILNTDYRPSVIFTNDEEIGCIGAGQLVEKFPVCPFDNAIAILQLDRKGYRDAVYYGCHNFLFEEWISTFGFITNTGSFSDISILCPSWNIAGVNLSVGYYNEHEFREYLKWDELEDAINKVILMIERSKVLDKRFEFIPKKDYVNPLIMECNKCNKKITYPLSYMVPVGDKEMPLVFCKSCYEKFKKI